MYEQELDGQLLLLRAGSSDVVHLDAVGSDAWRVLAYPSTREEVVATLAAAYGVEVERVAVDLPPLLDVLLSHGLVVEEEGS